MEKLDAGLHSTKGVGKTEPDPAGDKELDGCKVTEKCLQWFHIAAEIDLNLILMDAWLEETDVLISTFVK